MAIRVFGLTGGIGSGKSTVGRHFGAHGLPVIDADLLAREVLEPGSAALKEIAETFGPEALNPDGTMARAVMAERVFASPEQRARLESIVHPRVRALASARFAALEARGEPLACYEVPLLFEKGLEATLRPVAVVYCPEDLQVARASARDRADPAAIRARIAAQMRLADKAERADYVIDNSGSLATTLAESDQVLLRICQELGLDSARYFAPTPSSDAH